MSLRWLKECPRKYYYHMVQGWTGRGEAVHLEFGILYHKTLEEFERLRAAGQDHETAVHWTIGQLLQWTWKDGRPWRAAIDLDPADRASLKCREYLVRTAVWYMDKFRNDPAKTKLLPNGDP